MRWTEVAGYSAVTSDTVQNEKNLVDSGMRPPFKRSKDINILYHLGKEDRDGFPLAHDG